MTRRWSGGGRGSVAGARGRQQLRPEEVTPTEQSFLEAGRSALEADRREAEERAATSARQNRRLRMVLVGLAVVLVLALAAGLLALRSRAEEEESRVSAEAKRLAASALNEERRDLALLAAVESVRMEPGPETYGALLTLISPGAQVVTSHRADDRYLRIAAMADHDSVVLAENEPVLRALDAGDGRERWEVETPEAAQVGGITAQRRPVTTCSSPPRAHRRRRRPDRRA